MPKFLSDEWAQAYKEEMNQSRAFEEANRTWVGDFLFVIEPEPDSPIKQKVYVYVDVSRGKCHECYVTRDAGDKKAKFMISAPYSVWHKYFYGRLHLVVAVATRQFKVEGNMVELLRNVKAGQEFFECGVRVSARFPDPPDA